MWRKYLNSLIMIFYALELICMNVCFKLFKPIKISNWKIIRTKLLLFTIYLKISLLLC